MGARGAAAGLPAVVRRSGWIHPGVPTGGDGESSDGVSLVVGRSVPRRSRSPHDSASDIQRPVARPRHPPRPVAHAGAAGSR